MELNISNNMKWNQTYLYFILIILKYKILELFRTNIKCWFGHKDIDTSNINVKKCKRCDRSVLIINAIFEDE